MPFNLPAQSIMRMIGPPPPPRTHARIQSQHTHSILILSQNSRYQTHKSNYTFCTLVRKYVASQRSSGKYHILISVGLTLRRFGIHVLCARVVNAEHT